MNELGPYIKGFFIVLFRKLFGKDIGDLFNNTTVQVISISIILIGIGLIIYDLVKKYKYNKENNNTNEMISIKNGSDKTEIIKKDPMSRPDYAGEETGPCPVCGHSILIARKSRKTGELYFGCAAPKYGPKRGCNFKGCRSH